MKPQEPEDLPGYSYEVTEDQLDEYARLSPADRLRWLYAANAFLWKFTPPGNRRIWEAIREGRVPPSSSS